MLTRTFACAGRSALANAKDESRRNLASGIIEMVLWRV
jgi:hypothetical protein